MYCFTHNPVFNVCCTPCLLRQGLFLTQQYFVTRLAETATLAAPHYTSSVLAAGTLGAGPHLPSPSDRRSPSLSCSKHGFDRHTWLQVFLTQEHLAISMEFAQGGDLFAYTLGHRPHGRLAETQSRWIFQQLIIGLDYCHRKVGAALTRLSDVTQPSSHAPHPLTCRHAQHLEALSWPPQGQSQLAALVTTTRGGIGRLVPPQAGCIALV